MLIYVTPMGTPVYVLANRWYVVGLGWETGKSEDVIRENMLTPIRAEQRSGAEYDALVEAIRKKGLRVDGND